MTDLEITKLCAEAMGLQTIVINNGKIYVFDPLHDNAQAMALVKKFHLEIRCVMETWHVWDQLGKLGATLSKDLDSAIFECIAKIQEAKGKA